MRTVDGPADVHDIHITEEGLFVASSRNNRLWLVPSGTADPVAVWAASNAEEDEQHVNGVTSGNGTSIVSLFGLKRGRRWAEVMEGRLVRTDGRVVIEGLHHPHSPRLADGELWACESGRGDVIVIDGGGCRERIEIGGYTRGLWIGSEIVLVGVSAARARSRSEGTSNVVAPSDPGWAGFVVLDRQRRQLVDRVDLTGLGGEVFNLVVVDEFGLPPGRDAYDERCRGLVAALSRLEERNKADSEHSPRRLVPHGIGVHD